jgi:hypothetical protein
VRDPLDLEDLTNLISDRSAPRLVPEPERAGRNISVGPKRVQGAFSVRIAGSLTLKAPFNAIAALYFAHVVCDDAYRNTAVGESRAVRPCSRRRRLSTGVRRR